MESINTWKDIYEKLSRIQNYGLNFQIPNTIHDKQLATLRKMIVNPNI